VAGLTALRVAVIGRTGAGGYGHQLDAAFTSDARATIVAVADGDDEGRRACMERTGAARGYPDYAEMLSAEHPDIVVVAPRNMDCHEPMVMAALAAGAHVYCEKPIAQSLCEADRMVAAARQAGMKLGIALPAVHEGRLGDALGRLTAGQLGDLVQMRALCKWDHRGGGQDFLILGVHFADMMRRIAGNPETCYAKVSTAGRPITRADATAGAERCGLVAGERIWAAYTFPGQIIGTIESWRCDIADRDLQPYRLEIQGTSGSLMLRAPYADHSLWHCSDTAYMPGHSRWQRIDTAVVPTYGDYHEMAAADFLDAIEQGRDPLCSGSDGRAALEMIHAAYASQLRGGAVSLPLADRRHPLGADDA
jgi:predicted dehydrogenase